MFDESKIKLMAKSMRIDCLRMGLAAGGAGAHMGGALSCIEIVAVLYAAIMKKLPHSLDDDRDRFIMSKGHGVQAQYAALRSLGVIDGVELDTFKVDGTRLTAHPSIRKELGIDFATGSLGQGLSLGVGVALALKRKRNTAHVYVLLGDGECDEGSIWEAAMAAAHFGLDNVTVIVDANDIQYDDDVSSVMSLAPLSDKWVAFGWSAVDVDGHDVNELYNALCVSEDGRPRAIIAHTIKGKGVSFMEGDPTWHAQRVTPKLFELAMAELEN